MTALSSETRRGKLLLLCFVMLAACSSGALIPRAAKVKKIHGNGSNGFGVKCFELEKTERIGGSGDRKDYYVIQVGNFDGNSFLQGEGTEYLSDVNCDSIANVDPYLSDKVSKKGIVLEKYNGSFTNGVKEGKGMAEEYRSGKVFKRYQGDFRKGLPNGKGLFQLFGWEGKVSYSVTTEMTEKYFGFFRQGFFHGPGQWDVYNGQTPNQVISQYYGMYAFGKFEGIKVQNSQNEENSQQVAGGTEKILFRVPTNEFKSFFESDTLNNLSDVIEVGQRNKQGLLQGFGYRINNSGEFQVGYFSNGRLEGYGIQFRNLPEHKGLVASEKIEIVELRRGKWEKGKIYEGEQKRYANKQQPGTNFPGSYVQSAYSGKMLEIYPETYVGKFDENELFTGWGKYVYDEQDKIVTNAYGSLSRGYEYEYTGNFKQGKYHGTGDLKLKQVGRTIQETAAIYDMGVQRQIVSEKTHRSFAGLAYGTVIELNDTLGMIEKSEVLEKTLLDGRKIKEKDKYIVRDDLNSGIFFKTCPLCNGEGAKWETCSYTASTVTGYQEHRQIITMGSNTYIEKSYTPKYRTSVTNYPCPHKCPTCAGQKRLAITTPLPAKQYKRKN